MEVDQLPTPALLVDRAPFEHNVATMATKWPGRSLRPHVKAFKSTELARQLHRRGHVAFCCATIREVEGMASAGLGEDLLLANEVLDASRLGRVVERGAARVTVAVDSMETIRAAAAGGVREVLVDVDVGLPRCGCDPTDAGALATEARNVGLEVRGVMGYEGHVVGRADPEGRRDGAAAAMQRLLEAHRAVGGDTISGGGTGTWDCNPWVTELQAGSYTLMDTAYGGCRLPFRQAIWVLGTVISVGRQHAVADVGLKALGMDHGNPRIDGHTVWFCSDEHITFAPSEGTPMPQVGAKVRVVPAHLDPTVAMHERINVIDGSTVVDVWPVDLRNW